MRVLLLLLLTGTGFAQNTIQVQMIPKYGAHDLYLNQIYVDGNGTPFKVTRIQFYMHDFVIVHDGGQVTALNTTDNYVLTHGDQYFYSPGSANVTSIESVGFNIGVDTSLNHDDPALWPSNHPLALHTPSMHWGWASGYRFFALEIEVDTNGDGTTETLMQSHVVGDNFVRTIPPIAVTGVYEPGLIKVAVNYDLEAWLFNIDVATAGVNHGAGAVNMDIMSNPSNGDVFYAGTVLGTEEHGLNAELVYSDGVLRFSSLERVSGIEIYDLSGKLLQQAVFNSNSGEIAVESMNRLCLVRLFNSHSSVTRKMAFLR